MISSFWACSCFPFPQYYGVVISTITVAIHYCGDCQQIPQDPCPIGMTGRPGYWTMEMNGGSSAPYLACTPCVPLFVHCLIRVEAEGLLDYQGQAGIISIVGWNLRPVIFGVDKSTICLGVVSAHLLSVKKILRFVVCDLVQTY